MLRTAQFISQWYEANGFGKDPTVLLDLLPLVLCLYSEELSAFVLTLDPRLPQYLYNAATEMIPKTAVLQEHGTLDLNGYDFDYMVFADETNSASPRVVGEFSVPRVLRSVGGGMAGV